MTAQGPYEGGAAPSASEQLAKLTEMDVVGIALEVSKNNAAPQTVNAKVPSQATKPLPAVAAPSEKDERESGFNACCFKSLCLENARELKEAREIANRETLSAAYWKERADAFEALHVAAQCAASGYSDGLRDAGKLCLGFAREWGRSKHAKHFAVEIERRIIEAARRADRYLHSGEQRGERMSDERKRFEEWAAAGKWKPTESMWAAWEARADGEDAPTEAQKKLRDRILAERKKGNVVFWGLPDELMSAPLEKFVEQPAEGILYDLNRLEEVCLSFLTDRKWVNDFAVALTIRKLVEQRDALRASPPEAEGEGWRLVPVEINRATCRAMLVIWNKCMVDEATLETTWPLLVAVAPRHDRS
jgi:hypothetical protein